MAVVVGPGDNLGEDQIQDLFELAQVCRAYLGARRSGRVNDMEDALLSLEVLAKEYLNRWYSQDFP